MKCPICGEELKSEAYGNMPKIGAKTVQSCVYCPNGDFGTEIRRRRSMQIVIDIPEEWYRLVKFNDICNGSIVSQAILDAVGNGTPLPKGHGRLIDAREYENSIRKHYFDNSTVIRCTEIALDNAPTIIEADTESEDKV